MGQTPQRTLVRWRKYYELQPFGDDWQQAATVAAAAINPHTRRQRKTEDFIPKYMSQTDWSSAESVDRTTVNLNSFLHMYNSRRR